VREDKQDIWIVLARPQDAKSGFQEAKGQALGLKTKSVNLTQHLRSRPNRMEFARRLISSLDVVTPQGGTLSKRLQLETTALPCCDTVHRNNPIQAQPNAGSKQYKFFGTMRFQIA